MSKSLKNFITIRQALEGHTARQIRLVFLMKPWDKKLDFSDQTVDEAETKEKTLMSFFGPSTRLILTLSPFTSHPHPHLSPPTSHLSPLTLTSHLSPLTLTQPSLARSRQGVAP